MFVSNIFGQLDMDRAGLFFLGQAECLTHTARDIVRGCHLMGIFSNRAHHGNDVQNLKPPLL